MEDYAEKTKLYLADPENYVITKSKEFTWFKEWNQLHNYKSDPYDMRWFVDGHINITYDLLDKHVSNGHGDDLAFKFSNANDNTVTNFTYTDLLENVSKVAGVFAKCGIKQGDHVIINLPDIPESVISMLATVRLGAIYSMMATIHPEQVMVDRLDDFTPKIIITTNCEFGPNDEKINSKEYLDSILELSKHKPTKCIVLQRPFLEPAKLIEERDLDWIEAVKNADPHRAVPIEINEPSFIIYTSGTTGKPKGVIISARFIAMNCAIGADTFIGCRPKPDEHAVSYSMSRFVWIAGQLGGLYIPLHRRIVSTLYEGSFAKVKVADFYSFLVKHQVSRIFLPTFLLRNLIQQDPDGKIVDLYRHDIKLTKITLGGVPGDKKFFDWIHDHFKFNFGQVYGLTEVGVLTTVDLSDGHRYSDQPAKSCGKIVPGLTVKVLRQDGKEAAVNEVGRIAHLLPTPKVLSGFYNDKDNEKFITGYLTEYPGYLDLHDEGYFDSEGNLYVLNRSDSIFKIAGNRLSCDAIEETILTHPKVSECVVVTKFSQNGQDEIPIAFFIRNNGAEKSNGEDFPKELQHLVTNKFGVHVVLDDIIEVRAIPRTLTGKIALGTVKAIVRGNTLSVEDTKDQVLMHFWKMANKLANDE